MSMAVDPAKVRWPEQVDREFAEEDGLTPDNFDWEQWEVCDVRLEFPDMWNPYQALFYRCDMDPATPQANQYDENNHPIPDPTGIALSRVKFQLIDTSAHTLLDEKCAAHIRGDVQSGLNNGGPHGPALWRRLTPGSEMLHVKLRATPLFYYLTADGAAHAEYALQNQGYFSGETVESSPCTLSLTEEGTLLLNGNQGPEEGG